MDYKNRLKGSITQALAEALWGHAKYRVVPLGIEQVIRDVSSLDVSVYSKLNISNSLRQLPDFFVSTSDLKQHWLVEVKYRAGWNKKVAKELASDLVAQVQIWTPLHLLIFLGEPACKNGDKTPDPKWSIGIVNIEFKNKEVRTVEGRALADLQWTEFRRAQDVFPLISETAKENTLRQTASLLPGLASLSE